MNLTEIKTLLNQDSISKEIKESVLKKARAAIIDEMNVEVIVSRNDVTIDIYNEFGMLEGRDVIKYSDESEELEEEEAW